jgi:ectoine hydroxylase-related dioxygenase (phytanoyl-CoA dioxygenase family)
VHARPPLEILEALLSMRVQLDACGEMNGPLRVIPGSHRAGELTVAAIREWQERVAEVTCVAPRGSVLLVSPLLLHASAPAQSPGHRRVLQFQFTNRELPGGLDWHARIVIRD